MHTINLNLYEFRELGKESREKVLRDHRNINLDNCKWYSPTYNHFIEFCSIIGISVKNDQIFFNGFHGWKDGSAFSANVDLPKLMGALIYEVWKNDYPGIDLYFPNLEIDAAVFLLLADREIDAIVKIKALNDNSVRVVANFVCNTDQSANYNLIYYKLKLVENWINEVVIRLNGHLYGLLLDQYEALTTEDCIKDAIESANFVFTEDGTKCNHLLMYKSDKSL